MIVSDPEDLKYEKEHICKALKLNNYPDWIIDQKQSPDKPPPEEIDSVDPQSGQGGGHSASHRGVDSQDTSGGGFTQNSEEPVKKWFPIVIPYIRGLPEELRQIYKNYDVPAYFKPTSTLRQLIVRPKDKLKKERVVGLVCYIPA